MKEAQSLLLQLRTVLAEYYDKARAEYIEHGGDPVSIAPAPESAIPYRRAWLNGETAMRSLGSLKRDVDKIEETLEG